MEDIKREGNIGGKKKRKSEQGKMGAIKEVKGEEWLTTWHES